MMIEVGTSILRLLLSFERVSLCFEMLFFYLTLLLIKERDRTPETVYSS